MRPFTDFPEERLTITGAAFRFQSRACSLIVAADGAGGWAKTGLALVTIDSIARISAVNA